MHARQPFEPKLNTVYHFGVLAWWTMDSNPPWTIFSRIVTAVSVEQSSGPRKQCVRPHTMCWLNGVDNNNARENMRSMRPNGKTKKPCGRRKILQDSSS